MTADPPIPDDAVTEDAVPERPVAGDAVPGDAVHGDAAPRDSGRGDLARFLAAYHRVLARWPVPVERLRLESPYGLTAVLACGPADGPPLVLLHGGGATAAVWRANVAALSQARRVYAVDRIGEAGLSERGERPPRTPGDLMDWLDGVLGGLDIGSADLCGHSYGGWIALRYALHAPGRVRRLVLLDPTQCFAGLRPGYLRRGVPALLAPSERRARALVDWETGGAGLDPDAAELYALGVRFPGQKLVTGRRPGRGGLAALSMPVLVLLAGDSRAHDIGKVEAAARRALPGVTIEVLPGVSHHALPISRADALNERILGFLDR